MHSEQALQAGRAREGRHGASWHDTMINLAGRDILHSWGKFLFTGIGLGLLIGVTLSMAGIYRGMVDDAQVLIDNSGADMWVVQQGTLGPYAEPSSVRDDVWRGIAGLPGVAEAGNAAYLTIQMAHAGGEIRVMIVGMEPGHPGEPGLPPPAGRSCGRTTRPIADERTGLKLGDRVHLRRHEYTVVGLTRRMVSSCGDPMIFVPLKDAQEIQFLKDNDALVNERARTAANPAFNRPGVPGLLEAARRARAKPHRECRPGAPRAGRRSKRGRGRDPALEAPQRLHAGADGRDPGRQIDRHLRAQICMFLVILSVVTAAIVAFIIYTMTLAKVREIAVLKLIGAEPHHRRDDPATGARPRRDRLPRRADGRRAVGADLPEIRAAAARATRSRGFAL